MVTVGRNLGFWQADQQVAAATSATRMMPSVPCSDPAFSNAPRTCSNRTIQWGDELQRSRNGDVFKSWPDLGLMIAIRQLLWQPRSPLSGFERLAPRVVQIRQTLDGLPNAVRIRCLRARQGVERGPQF